MFIVVPKRKALITAPKTVADIPLLGSKTLQYKGKTICAIPHNVENNLILAKFGLRPPEPIRYYYDWPGRWTPFKHQVDTAAKMSTHPRFMCFSSMGTGKTMSVLWASDYLIKCGIVDRVVICSPLSTLQSVWGDSIFEHFIHRTYNVAHGAKRAEAIAAPSDYLIINHHGVKTCYDNLSKMHGRVLWIVDESAVFRNAQTDLYKFLWSLCGPKTDRMLWTLTGSPTPNSPTDIWAQAKLINPDLVPKYFGRFREQVMYQAGPYKWLPKEGWQNDVYGKLQPSVRYNIDECLELPPVTEQSRNVAMSKLQTKAYTEMLRDAVAEAKEGTITAINEAAKMTKLLQIACGLVYTENGTAAVLDPKERLKELKEVIDQSGRKCIVFVPFKHILEYLVKDLGKTLSVREISGDVSAGKRTAIFDEFQNGDLEVILAHPKCMAHGINLTAGHTIVWWAPVNDFEIYDQANARIRRPGQKNHQVIIHLAGEIKGKPTIESKIYTRLKNKEKVQGTLLELLKTL